MLGAAVTFYLGRRAGEAGLDMIPPPFAFTAVIVAAGAVDANLLRLFIAKFGFRLIRFGSEAALAAIYGRKIVGWMESDLFRDEAYFFAVLVVAGTIVSVIQFIRKTQSGRRPGPAKSVAR